MNADPQQLYLADDMQPPPDPEKSDAVDAVLYAWLDAKHEQRTAADTTKIRHLTLLAKLAEAGIERYPYLDRTTGQKRYVVADKTPKAKTVKAPTVGKAKRERKRKGTPPEERVEHRRVSRESVEDEIDPFAKTRRSMDGAQ